MKRLLFTIISSIVFVPFIFAQFDTIRYFESYFETTADRQQWTNVPSDESRNWIFDSKGGFIYQVSPELHENPAYAYEGTYNAFHAWSDIVTPDVRKIVSRPLDLSDSKKPELAFAHAMFQYFTYNNYLAVLFKAGSSAPWDTIIWYNNAIDEWTTHTLNIKDFGTKYLCRDFQFAFESTARGEFGVCVDSVVIEEKDIIIRYVKSLKARHIPQVPIPSGSKDIPVLRLDINVVGNTDPLVLNSIEFTSLSAHDSLFALNGFELVATKDSTFQPTSKSVSLKIGTQVNIVNGKIQFNSLNYNLSTGYNAIWLILDAKSTAPHKSIADFKINAGALNINGSTFPSTENSPPGFNYIEQSVFYDSFDGDTLWTLESDFEIAVAKGLNADNTEDPGYAYSNGKLLGTDITSDGKYRINITPANAYYATSPAIDLKYYTDVRLSFKKWFAFDGNDQGVIEVSNDDGVIWHRIWDSKVDGLMPDYEWVDFSLSTEFNAIAAHHSAVKIRFGIVSSNAFFAYAGFNVDNFAVTGKYLTNDVGIVDVIAPIDDCHNPGMDSVKITVHNYADRATSSSIPVFFSIDGSEYGKIIDYIPGPIPKDSTVAFTFSNPAEFPSPGNYNQFTVKLQASGDEDPDNDLKTKEIFIQKSLGPPNVEDFEISGGYWKVYGSNPTWLCKIPEGSIPSLFGNSWILSPFGNYITSDTSYLEGSCYNLISDDMLIYEMQLWIDSEEGKDGASVEYSVDEGSSWILLPAHEFPYDWPWYNGPVTSLGSPGFSGLNSGTWETVKQIIPASLLFEPKVKFRVKWASDEENTYRGMAIDQVKLYEAPADIGILQIDSFANRCQGINPDEVTVTIRNMGVNSLKENDTIIVGYHFNHIHAATDTFLLQEELLPGETIKHTLSGNINVNEPGNYNITAYTLIEDDPWFYNGNNDTVSLDFIVYPGPVTTLTDTIQTHLPDTVILRTLYNSEYDYWWNGVPGTETFNVSKDGWQYLTVTATRGNGCSTYDSTNVELLFYDVGMDSLIHPTDNCGFSQFEYPVVRIRNYGTDSIAAGQKIALTFQMNGGTVVEDTLKLTSTLYSGKTADFTFTKGAVNLAVQGNYDFYVCTSYGGDTITGNNSLNKSIEILGRPAVSLGPDITIEGLSHTLDAGPGYEGYMWDNGVTTRTREVTSSGSFWVQVYDTNMCDNYDTAYVRLKIRDISPQSFESPLSDCEFSAAAPVSIRIYNTGTDTVPSGSTIEVSYLFNGGDRVIGSMELDQQLVPGGFAVYPFAGTVDLSAAGDYDFEATAVTAGDLRSWNDTIAQTVYRYEKPVVDFGLEETEYIEDVSITLEAGYSPYYSYQWQDTATSHNYTVISDGMYHVTATDTRTSCFDRDSVFVFLIYSDVGVTWTSMGNSGCTGEVEDIVVRVTNLGPSSIGSSELYIACDIDGERITLDTLTWIGNFSPGAVKELPLSGRVGIEHEGINSVSLFTIFEADKRPENDSLTVAFDALPVPEIDFGDENGVLNNVELPYVLDAGAGHQSYLWQDNSTNQTYTANTAGEYWVTVTGQNDCQATKTVSINITDGTDNFEAGNIVLYPNPNNGKFRIKMENEADEDIVVKIVSLDGQPVYSREMTSRDLENETIGVENLPRGVYLLHVHTKIRVFTGRLVIH